MNKRNKIISFSGIAVILVILIVYFLFSKQPVCKQVEILISGEEKDLIIDRENIKTIIFTEYKDLIGRSFNTIDLSKIEYILQAHPSVKNAEVYKKMNGYLVVKLDSRIPIVRVMPVSGNDFYIDREGNLFPVSKIGSSRVMVANGNIRFKYDNSLKTIGKDTTVSKSVKEIFLIAQNISEDEFMKAQIEQIYRTGKNEYELIPTVGNHIVLLGDIFNYKKKISYLKHFYLHVINKVGWRTYDYISLKYKNQIVCRKSNT
jgi:cell division protein FtsQ